MSSAAEEFVAEEYYRSMNSAWNDEATLDHQISFKEKNKEGLLADRVQLYGMQPFTLDKLTVLEGELSKLKEPGGRFAAAVYSTDDYGNAIRNSHWAKIGDTVTVRYVEEYEYYDPNTGRILAPQNIPEAQPYRYRAKTYHDVDYEVAELVMVPHSLSYRYYGADEFVLNDQTFIQDSGTDHVMYYACDVTDAYSGDMDAYLSDLTKNKLPQLDYESKATYAAEFDSFRNMFLILGSVLSFIIGLIGVLNYFNAILTGILARRLELATLQCIGMSGKQLMTMLVLEGLYYTLGSVAVSFAFCIAAGPLLSDVLGSMFWFFTYHFTVEPILLAAPAFTALGIAVPIAVQRVVIRRSLVERLRDAE